LTSSAFNSVRVCYTDRELRGAAFFDVPMSRYMLTATAVAVLTVAIVDCIVYMYVKSVAFTATPTPGSALRCQCVEKTKKNLRPPSSKTPPWSFNATIRSDKVLYLWASEAGTHRLGNRLFDYASTYGIAWRNGRLPILPDPGNVSQEYDLARFFNLRMPVDQGNRIARVGP